MKKSIHGFFEPVTGIAVFMIFGGIALLISATGATSSADTSEGSDPRPVIVTQQSTTDNRSHETIKHR